MPNRCTVCFHRHLQQMDNAILRGELLTTIAKQYHVSVDALGRHRKHMRSAMSIALAKQPNRASDESYGNELLDKLERIVVDVEQVQQQAEAAQDMRLVLTACKQRSDLLELRGKLTGAIETGSKSFTINMPAPEPLEQTLADARMLS